MSIKLNLNGFEDLIKKLEQTGKSIDEASEICIKISAGIMNDELKRSMKKAKVSSDLIERMPHYEIKKVGNRFTAKAGYRKGPYDPKNISDGYKAVFINYGTKEREKRGHIDETEFIKEAKINAKRKIKKKQEKMMKDIVKKLK